MNTLLTQDFIVLFQNLVFLFLPPLKFIKASILSSVECKFYGEIQNF